MNPTPQGTSKIIEADATKSDTRERILAEAERLFRHYGISKTTVADIAQSLKMSPANVYRFFGSKAEITEAIAERFVQQKEAMAQQIADLPISAADRLRAFVTKSHGYTVATLTGDAKVHEMVVVAMDEQWSTIQTHLVRITKILEQIISSGIATGEFRKQDPVVAARCAHQCFVSVCHPQIVVQCMRDPGNYASAEQVADFVIASLRA